jgi:hypothetical protein
MQFDFSILTRRQRKTTPPTPSRQPSPPQATRQTEEYRRRLRASSRPLPPVPGPADSTTPEQTTSTRLHLRQQAAEARRSSTRKRP